MRSFKRNLRAVPALTLLVALTSGCAVTGHGGSRSAALPIPVCPPEQVEMQVGWLGPGFITTDAGPLHVFVLSVTERLQYEAWVDGWKSCAKARGIVIEEANR